MSFYRNYLYSITTQTGDIGKILKTWYSTTNNGYLYNARGKSTKYCPSIDYVDDNILAMVLAGFTNYDGCYGTKNLKPLSMIFYSFDTECYKFGYRSDLWGGGAVGCDQSGFPDYIWAIPFYKNGYMYVYSCGSSRADTSSTIPERFSVGRIQVPHCVSCESTPPISLDTVVSEGVTSVYKVDLSTETVIIEVNYNTYKKIPIGGDTLVSATQSEFDNAIYAHDLYNNGHYYGGYVKNGIFTPYTAADFPSIDYSFDTNTGEITFVIDGRTFTITDIPVSELTGGNAYFQKGLFINVQTTTYVNPIIVGFSKIKRFIVFQLVKYIDDGGANKATHGTLIPIYY